MLGVPRCVEVEDGSYIYLDPSLTVAWADGITIATADGKQRVVCHDSTHVLRRADADRLVGDGLAAPVGGRLFEQPELMEAVFAWDNTSEADFIVRVLGPAAAGRGVEFGCGTGRILLKLRERGLTVDGVDASEPVIRHLRQRLLDQGLDETELVLADIAACAFPGRYDYAVAALNTLRCLPSHAALRRHLHLAALTVRPGGVYVVMVDSWQPGASPEYGSAAEWPATLPDGRTVTVRWTRVSHEPASRMDLESVELTDGQGYVFREFQTQLAMPVPDWQHAFTDAGEWRVEATYLDGYPQPVPVDEGAEPTDGNFWFILRRTDHSADPLFTR